MCRQWQGRICNGIYALRIFFVVVLLFVIFGIDAYTKGQALLATALLFLLYGPAVAAQTYCLSYLFKSHSTAQNVILILNFISGLALMITSFVLDAIESTRDGDVVIASCRGGWRADGDGAAVRIGGVV